MIALYGKSNKKLIIHACEIMYADLMKGRFCLKEDKHRITYIKDRNMFYMNTCISRSLHLKLFVHFAFISL